MDWIITSLHWYIVLAAIGLIFFPFTRRIFAGKFLDFGYPFAKTIALIFITYSIFVLGILKILPFTQISLFFLIFLFILINLYFFKYRKKNGLINKPQKKSGNAASETEIYNKSIFLIILEEVLFLTAFLFWVFVRGQEPSLRGLEKFMDFGFINSILKSKYFPPLDMWLSADPTHPKGYPINYYYFGHLTGAMLIKLSGIKASIGYNLILASVFALSVTQAFSLIVGIIYTYFGRAKSFLNKNFSFVKLIIFGVVGSYIVNLGGNLHTIYVFTTGYPNDNPIPFWKILSWYNPAKYWYPNATRFIPYTIHEFPSYSWVVADLHGHVYDIPFVLLTLGILFIFFIRIKHQKDAKFKQTQKTKPEKQNLLEPFEKWKKFFFNNNYQFIATSLFLGFLAAIHYMTNAFDGPIYILLAGVLFFFAFGWTKELFINILVLVVSFVIFAYPFSAHFSPFVSGIGVNCSPDFLVNLQKLGPFLFEKDKCQASPFWMLFVLWGFFWINFIIFSLIKYFNNKHNNEENEDKQNQMSVDIFILTLFSIGTFFVIIPEFFYIKDIYPAHFRANTMFKLGYQAFIMMGIASIYTLLKIKELTRLKSTFFTIIFIFLLMFVIIYPIYSIPSYYGNLNRPVELDGSLWINSFSPEDAEIINYLNKNVQGQPIVLEAQGDSYTDYDLISAYTGLPTIAGWWVHEWLWRGSADVVGSRIPDIVNIYESDDLNLTKNLLQKYHVQYVVVSKMEKQKYINLQENKFLKLGTLKFRTSNGVGALYQINKIE